MKRLGIIGATLLALVALAFWCARHHVPQHEHQQLASAPPVPGPAPVQSTPAPLVETRAPNEPAPTEPAPTKPTPTVPSIALQSTVPPQTSTPVTSALPKKVITNTSKKSRNAKRAVTSKRKVGVAPKVAKRITKGTPTAKARAKGISRPKLSKRAGVRWKGKRYAKAQRYSARSCTSRTAGVLGSVCFGLNSAKLTAESRRQLAVFAKQIKANKLSIEIAGYADASGSKTANQQLSELRAKQVERFLSGQGVQIDTSKVAGLGDVEARKGQQHRRVDLKVLQP